LRREASTFRETGWWRGKIALLSHLQDHSHPGRKMILEMAVKEPVSCNRNNYYWNMVKKLRRRRSAEI
jgi:hypothetical protein